MSHLTPNVCSTLQISCAHESLAFAVSFKSRKTFSSHKLSLSFKQITFVVAFHLTSLGCKLCSHTWLFTLFLPFLYSYSIPIPIRQEKFMFSAFSPHTFYSDRLYLVMFLLLPLLRLSSTSSIPNRVRSLLHYVWTATIYHLQDVTCVPVSLPALDACLLGPSSLLQFASQTCLAQIHIAGNPQPPSASLIASWSPRFWMRSLIYISCFGSKYLLSFTSFTWLNK